jgi:general secretion pathway protein G
MRTLSAGKTELAVVVAVLFVFAATIQIDYRPKGGGRARHARIQIIIYLTALEQYKSDTGSYPTTQQGLQALRAKPDNVNNWRGPYVQHDIDTDPWRHAYIYKFPGDHGDKPDIICYGADGKPEEKA